MYLGFFISQSQPAKRQCGLRSDRRYKAYWRDQNRVSKQATHPSCGWRSAEVKAISVATSNWLSDGKLFVWAVEMANEGWQMRLEAWFSISKSWWNSKSTETWPFENRSTHLWLKRRIVVNLLIYPQWARQYLSTLCRWGSVCMDQWGGEGNVLMHPRHSWRAQSSSIFFVSLLRLITAKLDESHHCEPTKLMNYIVQEFVEGAVARRSAPAKF